MGKRVDSKFELVLSYLAAEVDKAFAASNFFNNALLNGVTKYQSDDLLEIVRESIFQIEHDVHEELSTKKFLNPEHHPEQDRICIVPEMYLGLVVVKGKDKLIKGTFLDGKNGYPFYDFEIDPRASYRSFNMIEFKKIKYSNSSEQGDEESGINFCLLIDRPRFRVKEIVVTLSLDDLGNSFDIFDGFTWMKLVKLMAGVVGKVYEIYITCERQYFGTTNNDLALLLLFVQALIVREFREKNDVSLADSLVYLNHLIALNLLKLSSVYQKMEYIEMGAMILGQKYQNEGRWNRLISLYNEACSEAKSLWIDGDSRLHHKMVDYLLEKYNAPIVKSIEEDLRKKFPNRRSKIEKEKYEKEMKSLLVQSTMSRQMLKKKIKDIAKEFDKYFDPGAKHRNA